MGFRGVLINDENRPTAKALAGNGFNVAGNGSSGFGAAGNGRRLFNFPGSSRGINSIIINDGAALLARARKSALDNPWVVSAIRGFKADVVGDGIKPHFQHKRKRVREVLTKTWDRWADEADASFDPQSRKGIRNLYGIQMHVAGEVMEAGESFGRYRPRFIEDGLTVPLQIQLIDPEQVPLYKQDGGAGNNVVRGGVEFDAIGRRVAYHMYRQHPGDSMVWPNSLEIVRVPGASVFHVFDPLRGNPIRGVTWLASLLIKLEDLRQYDDATVLRQKMAAFFLGWQSAINPQEPLFRSDTEASGQQAPPPAPAEDLPPDTIRSMVEAGTMLALDPGEEIHWNAPPDPGNQYEMFMRVQLRAVSRVLMRCYHQLTGDVSQTSFSSIRADIGNIRRELSQFQFNVICVQFCEPALKAFMDAAALAGVIDAADYAANQSEYLNVEWRTARWAYVNPLQDIEAEVMMIRSGLKPRSATILELGYDPEQIDQTIKDDQERADGLSLVYDSDGRRPKGAGAADLSPEADAAQNPASPVTPQPNQKTKQILQ